MERFSSRRRVSALGAGALAALALIAGTSATHAHAAGPAVPGFGTPTAAGPSGNGFETDLALDNTRGAGQPEIAYEAAPQSLSSTISTTVRSLDGGQTFKLVPGQASGTSGGKNDLCPAGGGDIELNVDAGGHLYYNDLTLANFSVSRSDDQGTTWNGGTSCAGVPDAGVDREWYASYGEPTLGYPTGSPIDPTTGGYLGLTYDRVETPNTAVCTGFTDPSVNGNVLSANLNTSVGSLAGVEFGPAQTLSCDEGIMGNDEMYNYGANGGLIFYVIHDNEALNDVSMVSCSVVGISVTNTTGFANCADNVVSSFPGFVTGANFPTMAVDNTGGLIATWEEAQGSGAGAITGNTMLYFATSTDHGATWSAAKEIPTDTLGGLHQNVFVWPAAGDPGRFDVSFLGAPEAWKSGDVDGPDSISGHYGLYMVQTLDGGTTWTITEPSEHFIHYGTMYTLIGSQTGSRDLGDFLKMAVGPQGEANISFSDSNNQNSSSVSAPMFVRQLSGPSLYAAVGSVSIAGPTAATCTAGTGVTDPSGDGTFDAAGQVGPNNPNLDLTQVCMSQPDSTHYQVTMTVNDLTSLTPGAQAGGSTLVWQAQWHQPSSADTTNGGNYWFADAESVGGQAPTCFDGQAAIIAVGGGIELTFPGQNQLPATDCVVTQGAPGTITITVPISDVSVASPDNTTLYSVTGNTETLTAGNSNDPPDTAGIGGQLPNIIDVAPAFDFTPSPASNVAEVPWAPLLLLGGLMTLAVGVRRRRLRRS